MKIMASNREYLITWVLVFGLILGTFPFILNAQVSTRNRPVISSDRTHLMGLVCEALGSIGVGCINAQANLSGVGSSGTESGGAVSPAITPRTDDGTGNLGASIVGSAIPVRRNITNEDVTLVSIPGSPEIYEIIKGKKHLMPNLDIFYDYGYALNMVYDISAQDLAKFPRAKLAVVHEENFNMVYYLTEPGLIRLIPGDETFRSYGDREEDVITISKKEFNFYPRNQFIFVEHPVLNRDVFQIVDGAKRYVTPRAIQRMKLNEWEIAPVNSVEMDAYSISDPVVF